MLLTSDARGVFPIAPTPFFDDGSIDLVSVDRLTDFYLGCGATGITVLGQLGEAPKLEHDEAVSVAARMIRRAARLPVVVGVSAPGFAAMRALTRAVMDEGAAGVMIAPPHTLRTTIRSSATTARRSRRSAPTCRSCCRTIRSRSRCR